MKCPGRLERFDLPDDVLAVVDVAHNEDSITALCDCLRDRFADRSITVVFGTSVDKSADTMLQRLSDIADELILTRFHTNPRFVDPKDLLPLLQQGWSGQSPDHCRAHQGLPECLGNGLAGWRSGDLRILLFGCRNEAVGRVRCHAVELRAVDRIAKWIVAWSPIQQDESQLGDGQFDFILRQPHLMRDLGRIMPSGQ